MEFFLKISSVYPPFSAFSFAATTAVFWLATKEMSFGFLAHLCFSDVLLLLKVTNLWIERMLPPFERPAPEEDNLWLAVPPHWSRMPSVVKRNSQSQGILLQSRMLDRRNSSSSSSQTLSISCSVPSLFLLLLPSIDILLWSRTFFASSSSQTLPISTSGPVLFLLLLPSILLSNPTHQYLCSCSIPPSLSSLASSSGAGSSVPPPPLKSYLSVPLSLCVGFESRMLGRRRRNRTGPEVLMGRVWEEEEAKKVLLQRRISMLGRRRRNREGTEQLIDRVWEEEEELFLLSSILLWRRIPCDWLFLFTTEGILLQWGGTANHRLSSSGAGRSKGGSILSIHKFVTFNSSSTSEKHRCAKNPKDISLVASQNTAVVAAKLNALKGG